MTSQNYLCPPNFSSLSPPTVVQHYLVNVRFQGYLYQSVSELSQSALVSANSHPRQPYFIMKAEFNVLEIPIIF